MESVLNIWDIMSQYVTPLGIIKILNMETKIITKKEGQKGRKRRGETRMERKVEEEKERERDMRE